MRVLHCTVFFLISRGLQEKKTLLFPPINEAPHDPAFAHNPVKEGDRSLILFALIEKPQNCRAAKGRHADIIGEGEERDALALAQRHSDGR